MGNKKGMRRLGSNHRESRTSWDSVTEGGEGRKGLCGCGLVVGSLDRCDLCLFLGNAFRQHGIELGLLLLLVFESAALKGVQVTAALETEGGDKSLNFGSLGVRLGTLLLRGDLSPDDILPHIILLRQVEELPDLRRPLGPEPLGEHVIRQPGDIALALLDDDQRQDGNVGADDTSTDRFALALSGAAGAVARVAVGEKEFDTVRQQDTLLHGETLLVVTAGDTEDITLPFVANRVGRDLLGNFLFVEDAVSLFIVDVDGLLGPSCGVGDIELHA